MERLTISIDDGLVGAFNTLTAEQGYTNRSEPSAPSPTPSRRSAGLGSPNSTSSQRRFTGITEPANTTPTDRKDMPRRVVSRVFRGPRADMGSLPQLGPPSGLSATPIGHSIRRKLIVGNCL